MSMFNLPNNINLSDHGSQPLPGGGNVPQHARSDVSESDYELPGAPSRGAGNRRRPYSEGEGEDAAERELFGEDEASGHADRRSVAESSAWGDDPDHPTLQRMKVDISRMEGFKEVMLGVGITPRPVANPTGINSDWCYLVIESLEQAPIPVQRKCVNVPISAWAPDATMVRDWATPANADVRARFTAIAALLSMLFAGTSLGYVSGDHAEVAEMIARGLEGDDLAKAIEGLVPISTYVYRAAKRPDGSYLDWDTICQQWNLGVEPLYDKATKSHIVALRFWKLVSILFEPDPPRLRVQIAIWKLPHAKKRGSPRSEWFSGKLSKHRHFGACGR